MKSLLAEAHPLAGEAVVQRKEEPDGGGETGEEPKDQPHADRHLTVRLELCEEGRVREDSVLEEILIPADGISRCELGHARGLKRHKARRDDGVRDAPERSDGELRPNRLQKPGADDDPEKHDPTLRAEHAH